MTDIKYKGITAIKSYNYQTKRAQKSEQSPHNRTQTGMANNKSRGSSEIQKGKKVDVSKEAKKEAVQHK